MDALSGVAEISMIVEARRVAEVADFQRLKFTARHVWELAFGTGAGQANAIRQWAWTTTAGVYSTLCTLRDADVFGDTQLATAAKAFYIENPSNVDAIVSTGEYPPGSLLEGVAIFGGWTSAPWGEGDLLIPPGGSALFIEPGDGWPVAAGDDDFVVTTYETGDGADVRGVAILKV